MEPWNSTLESGFILVGILDGSGSPELLCATVTTLYMLALISNGLLLLVITVDARLHVPMYLLLRQLSLIDLLFTSVVTPNTVVDFLLRDNTISFEGCALQLFSAMTLGGAEDLLLAFMAYDRSETAPGQMRAQGLLRAQYLCNRCPQHSRREPTFKVIWRFLDGIHTENDTAWEGLGGRRTDFSESRAESLGYS